MSPELFRHIAECRQRGLTIDEDFERGVEQRGRQLGTTAIALFTIVLALILATLLKPRRPESVLTPPNIVPKGERPATSRARSPFHHEIVRLEKANT